MEKGTAIKLVDISESGEFCIPDKTMNVLQEIGDKRVAPIVIAGPWRSGKSFLANRLIGRMKGFAIGSTVSACTKGIWMWNQPVKLPNEDTYALILDTEGLNSTKRSTNTDIKLFALSVLLSSLFIYNSRGHITETSIEDFSLVIKLTELIHIKKTDSESGVDFHKYFPTFFWVLRDFSLDLKGKSPREYLENNLKQQNAMDEEGVQKNSIRRTIAGFFVERDCFTLVRPVNEEEKIAHIEDMKYEELRPEFTKACDVLMHKIMARDRVKTVNGVPLTASMFMGLALEYVQCLNDHETPTITTAMERVLLDEARRHTENIFEKFAAMLAEKIPASALPMEEDEIVPIIEQCKIEVSGELIRELRELCSPADLTDNFAKFDTRLKIEVDKVLEMNMEASEEKCKELLQELTEKMNIPKVSSTDDLKPTLIMDFTTEWTKLIEDYYENSKGPAKDSIIVEFARNKTLTSLGELLKDVVDAYSDVDSKLQLQLSKLQSSEKKWKTLFENNEKILAERGKEKDELMAKNSELELKDDQLQRDLKTKENEIKSLKNYQEMAVSGLKQMNETILKEKSSTLDDLSRKLTSINERVNELEGENQKLKGENARNVAQLKNHSKMLEQSLDENKNKSKSEQHQAVISSLYKSIKSGLDEFKGLLDEVDDISKMKKQMLDLQKKRNDKEFASNTKLLEMRKKAKDQLSQVKSAHENETRLLSEELDTLKGNNKEMQDKLLQAEQNIEMLEAKMETIREEKKAVEESTNLKEELIHQYKASLTEEGKKKEAEVTERQNVEMNINSSKVDLALRLNDTEQIMQFICSLEKKYSKKKLDIKKIYENLKSEKMRDVVLERLSSNNVANDIFD